MRTILTCAVIVLTISLCACNKAESKDTADKNKTETLSYAMKIDLFNSIEGLIEKLCKKEYIKSYDSLNEIYKLSSKNNIVSGKSDPLANQFIETLDQLSKKISTESNKQKNDEIFFAYEKSRLSLLSSINKESDSKSSGQDQSSDKGGMTSKKDGGSGDSANKDQENPIIIPEEEALKKYPEILMTKHDYEIEDSAINLLGYISKITLDNKKENLPAIVNRGKYLLYKIKSLAKLEQYKEAKELIQEAQNNSDALYLKVNEKNHEDMITLNSLLKNITLSLEVENPVAVDLQSKVAIEVLNNLSAKSD